MQIKSKNYSLSIFIATACLYAVAIIQVPVGNPRLAFAVMFQGAGVLFISYLLIKKINLWIGLFLLLSWLSTLKIYMIKNKIKLQSLNSQEAFLYVLLGILWYCCIYKGIKGYQIKYLLNAFCIIALIHTVIIILQRLKLDPLTYNVRFTARNIKPVGLLGNPNEVSALLALCFPAFLRKRWKWCLIPFFIGVVLSRSSLGFLSVIFSGIIYLLFINYKIALFGLLTSIIGGGLYYKFIDKPTVWARWAVWESLWEVYIVRWIKGLGLGHWQVVTAQIKKIDVNIYKELLRADGKVWWRYAHNEFFQALFEMGAGFIIILIGYLISTIKKFKKNALISFIALISIIVLSTGHFLFHIAPTAIIALTWLAILQIQLEADNVERKALCDV